MSLAADTTREQDARTATTRAVCSYCGVGCGIDVTATGSQTARVVSKVSGDRSHPANHGRLCTKGATHVELMAAPGRMTTALIRPARGEEAVPVALDAAIAQAGRRLRNIVDEHGPDAVAVYVSGQMSTEAQYLSNKLVKGFLRGRHLESNSRLCMASAGTGYKQSLGADGPPGSYEDIDAADLFFVIGSNTADCHPILFLRLADRLKRGARLIVADPRRTATAERADLFLQLRPGTDLALLNGLLHVLIDSGAIDRGFIDEHTEGWEDVVALVADYSPDRVADITGLQADDIRLAARWIAEAGEWMTLWTMGLNQSTQGTWNTNAICNLHLATGAICRTGSGPFSLTGQPNAMGGREMGYMGPGLPGQRSVLSADDRAFTEERWGIEPGSLRAEASTGTIDMYRRMAEGEIRAAWIICTNPVASVANRRTVIEGLEKADLVIVQDVFTETATNAYADILLPATMWVEAEGVMVNSDRTLTLLQRAADPPGDAQPDWMLICRMARAMGFDDGFGFTTSEEVFDELRAFWNPQTGWDLRGIDYARLRDEPVQWPCPPGDARSRHPIRYLNDGVSQHPHITGGERPRLAFATPSRKAQFLARPHLGPAELPDDDYPWVLNTGRVQHQWHTLTKTGRIDKLNRLNPGPFVELNPEDAAALGISEGDQVEVASRRGRVVLPAVVTDRVQPGGCFAPFHWNDEHGEYVSVNAVTNDAVDEASLQPEFKYAAVALRRVGPAPDRPGPAQPASVPVKALTGAMPAMSEDESAYVTGFFAALETIPIERGAVPTVPTTAPLSEPVRLWLTGALAGAYSRTTVASLGSEVTVLWGSQTGGAEEFARATVAALAGRGVSARLVGMDEIDPSELAGLGHLLVITSTFGDGGPPDNGAAFWEQLSAEHAPALETLRYAVLAMGDSSYDDFCGHGRSLDERLGELGATALVDRVDCEPGDDGRARRWLERIVATLVDEVGGAAASVVPTAPAHTPATKLFTRANPVSVPIVGNEQLTLEGSRKEVRRIAFDLSGTGARYEAGDSLGIVCRNGATLVDEWLAATALSPREIVELDGQEQYLGNALRTGVDITKVTPELLRLLADRSADSLLSTLLRRENKSRLDQFLWGRQAIDLLHAFPVQASAVEWLDVHKRLQHRQYSISSSPKTDPDAVELTVSVVRFETEDGRQRGGVGSTLLADGEADAAIPVYLQRSAHFRPPADRATPMIMVGPGTGVAPFRAFLHDRRADGATGRNWLFFGEQHEATDFYYRAELEDMRDDGLLTRLDLAFSRDQRQKVYVQDRMIEHGARVWQWLQEGAHFYVCGDAARMARDVDEALVTIARVHGALPEDAARAYVRELSAAKRYVRDVY